MMAYGKIPFRQSLDWTYTYGSHAVRLTALDYFQTDATVFLSERRSTFSLLDILQGSFYCVCFSFQVGSPLGPPQISSRGIYKSTAQQHP